jgi:lipoprotein-releasing system permease protein
LQIDLGDSFNMLFVKDDPSKAPWLRVVTAVGIYDSGFSEFDKNFVIGDLRHVQKMNRWEDDQIGGFEVLLEDFDEIELKSAEVYRATPSTLDTQSIIEKYFEIFEWIKVFLNNTYLIIAIIILVAGINMITALLVLILERTQMVGMLKALGGTNLSVRKVFLYNAGYLILKGLFWGNLIGIGVISVQKYFNVISLNPETYYVDSVPISIDFSQILLLNIGTLLLCMTMLILPTLIISRISPVKSIKFE